MQPVILLGLDGATFTTLEPLLADGHMPNLQKFLNEGIRGEMLSTPHPLTPPAWTTLITGRSPGNHGVFDFVRADVRPTGAFFTLTNFSDIQCETLWTLISRWGGRVVSLNYPVLFPPPAVNGAIVPGEISWRHLRRNVYPPELYEEIKALPGFDSREFSTEAEEVTAALNMSEEALIPWVRQQVLRREAHWFTILKHLLRTEPADLTAIVFDSVDKIQHVCWRFLDPAFLPKQLNEVERTLRGLCLDYFRQLDGYLGQVFEIVGPQATVFIVSDHGFGPTLKSFRVNKWLEQQGYLRWPDAAEDASRKNSHFVHLDWANSTVWAQSAPSNGLWIRVRQGADGPGVPPEQYPAFRGRLIEQLRGVRDPDTGLPFLKDVLVRELAFSGKHQDKAPDLTLVPHDHGFITVLNQEPVIAPRPGVWGTHYPRGILLARGPGIPTGREIPCQNILDMAPTLLYSLGLPIPADFEGKVIQALYEAAHWQAHPVQIGPPTEAKTSRASTAEPQKAEMEEAVFTRLRDLGYVE